MQDLKVTREVGLFAKRMVDEIYNVPFDQKPCFFNWRTKVEYYHLNSGDCGHGDYQFCYEIPRLKSSLLMDLLENKEKAWAVVEVAEKRVLVLRVRNEGSDILTQYDKRIDDTLWPQFKAAGQEIGIYYFQPVLRVIANKEKIKA